MPGFAEGAAIAHHGCRPIREMWRCAGRKRSGDGGSGRNRPDGLIRGGLDATPMETNDTPAGYP